MYSKGRFYRDKRYLDYIRSLPCLVTGRTDVVAHHVRLNQAAGIGIKPSDYRTVPIDPIEHRKLHDMGEKSYWSKHKIDAEREVISQMLVYLNTEIESDTRVGIKCLEDALWQLRGISRNIS